jgi:hypothetical protein
MAVTSTASSAMAGISGDSSGGGSSIGDRNVISGDNGSTGEGSGDVGSGGDGRISDGNDDSTGGNCGDRGGDNVIKGGDCRIGDSSDDDTRGNCGGCGGGGNVWSPRRKSNASVAFADKVGKPRSNRSVSTDARAINIAQ